MLRKESGPNLRSVNTNFITQGQTHHREFNLNSNTVNFLMKVIQATSLKFLKQLAANNNRDWFLKHKNQYDAAHANMLSFVEELMVLLNRHDKISTDSARRAMYRIYSDVRFQKNRPPYTARFAAHFGREKPMLRGGYNLVIKPG